MERFPNLRNYVSVPPFSCPVAILRLRLRRYPLSVSGDSITTYELAYPRRTSAAGLREGHGWVCVNTRNDLLL